MSALHIQATAMKSTNTVEASSSSTLTNFNDASAIMSLSALSDVAGSLHEMSAVVGQEPAESSQVTNEDLGKVMGALQAVIEEMETGIVSGALLASDVLREVSKLVADCSLKSQQDYENAVKAERPMSEKQKILQKLGEAFKCVLDIVTVAVGVLTDNPAIAVVGLVMLTQDVAAASGKPFNLFEMIGTYIIPVIPALKAMSVPDSWAKAIGVTLLLLPLVFMDPEAVVQEDVSTATTETTDRIAKLGSRMTKAMVVQLSGAIDDDTNAIVGSLGLNQTVATYLKMAISILVTAAMLWYTTSATKEIAELKQLIDRAGAAVHQTESGIRAMAEKVGEKIMNFLRSFNPNLNAPQIGTLMNMTRVLEFAFGISQAAMQMGSGALHIEMGKESEKLAKINADSEIWNSLTRLVSDLQDTVGKWNKSSMNGVGSMNQSFGAFNGGMTAMTKAAERL